jgi:hypothetical protein
MPHLVMESNRIGPIIGDRALRMQPPPPNSLHGIPTQAGTAPLDVKLSLGSKWTEPNPSLRIG